MSNSHKRNHVLSECLLERFQDSRGNIVRYDVIRSKAKVTQPGREGFRRDLWRRTSAKTMEELWNQQAEGEIGVVILKLDQRQNLTADERELLARFCAVHFVRSHEFIKLYRTLAEQKCSTSIMDPRLDFTTRYRVRLGLLKEIRIPSQHFEDAMKEHYFNAVDYLKGFGVEMGIATGGNKFILPDGGLMIADAQKGKYQPTGGVALMEARQGIMPLGPTLLLAFSSKVKGVVYRDLNDDEVASANTKLLKACHEFYYCQPTPSI